ncbi:MAG TPA: GerMN domain-containing protein [Vicinamibacterales bacterium]|nr:GerMN domain-containing protein [Vicinamibacterales bacterium]
MRRPPLFTTLAVVLTLAIGWLLLIALPRWYGPREPAPLAGAALAQPEAARKITATLFYISDDGSRLTSAKREVAFAAAPADQARRIIEAALLPPPAPHATAIPQGTKLRALFLTGRGEAYVDFSRDIATTHGGGSLNELFTVYAIVNALTVNLPAVTAVQILVDGKEVDTLAGHVDLRRPLGKNLKWTEQ